VAQFDLVRSMPSHPPKRQFSSNEEFYSFIDTIAQRLRSSGHVPDGERLNTLVHKVAWTTSTELFGELRIALRKIPEQRGSVDAIVLSDITTAIAAIDVALSARARSRVYFVVPPQDGLTHR